MQKLIKTLKSSQNRKVLAENLEFWTGRLYLHFYIEYYVGQNAYAFQTTYRLDEIKPLISMMVEDQVSYTGECTYIATLINSSDQRIIK